ncbi:MAG: thioredoxin family protein [Gemmatimonadota bacterium]
MDEHTQEIDALEGLADPEAARALEGTLQTLENETEILLFVARGCPACPHQVRSAATVALASSKVALEVVDAGQEPELAARYEIGSVPTTVVDDELIMVGVIPPGELALRLIERQGPDAEKRVFTALVEAGRHTDAAERLADGRGTDGFLELWERSTMEQRMALLLVAEESLLYDPWGLKPLVPRLVAGLEGDGPLAQDDSRRGDTADLLGKTGDEAARPALERLAADANPAVAEAAREALAELDE